MPYYPVIPPGTGGPGLTLLPYMTGITVNPTAITMSAGTQQFNASGTLSGVLGLSSGVLSATFLSWSCSDTAYATVSQAGLATFVSGNTTGNTVYISASMLGDVFGTVSMLVKTAAVENQYLISETGSTTVLTHIYVSSSGLVDTKSRAWGQVGTVYKVNATGHTPATIGYWTGSFTNYLTSTDSNAQRPTGNFNATIVLSSSVGMGGKVAGWNSTGGGNYYLYCTTNTNLQYQDGGNLNPAGTMTNGPQVYVISFGRSGTTQYCKVNRQSTTSVAAGTPAAETTVFIGRGTGAGQQWDKPIYEFFLSSDAWDETAIAARNSATLAFFGQ